MHAKLWRSLLFALHRTTAGKVVRFRWLRGFSPDNVLQIEALKIQASCNIFEAISSSSPPNMSNEGLNCKSGSGHSLPVFNARSTTWLMSGSAMDMKLRI